MGAREVQVDHKAFLHQSAVWSLLWQLHIITVQMITPLSLQKESDCWEIYM